MKYNVKCPSCGAENTNEHDADFLTCRCCGCAFGDEDLKGTNEVKG